jgi:prophage regulatory protein
LFLDRIGFGFQMVALDFNRGDHMTKQAVDQILRPREVIKITGLGRTTIWRGVKAGTFPRPIRLTSSTIGWCQTDLAHWLAKRRAAAGLPDTNSE